MKQKKIKLLLLFLAASTVLFAQDDTVQRIVPGRSNTAEQMNKPYLILISIDGFRHDYIKKHSATFLGKKADEGVQAASLIPSFPSITFPNHYTLATGLYPSHHGLVANYFLEPASGERYSMKSNATVTDGKWYGGMPLWSLAESQGMLTASFYWVGTEAEIAGYRPTYYYKYNEKIPSHRRVEIVKNWLELPEAKRPHLISFYFPEVDHAGHDFGPDAPQTRAAVQEVDSVIRQLSQMAQGTGLPINFIIVSDHGMTLIDHQNPLRLPAVDTASFQVYVHAEMVSLYAKRKDSIDATYRRLQAAGQASGHYKVYLKKDVPKHLKFDASNDRYGRIPDILVLPDAPKAFAAVGRRLDPGAHGYDPYAVKDMHAVFFGWGPGIKKRKQLSSFPNVDVYPVVAKLLGLQIKTNIDGKKRLARKTVR